MFHDELRFCIVGMNGGRANSLRRSGEGNKLFCKGEFSFGWRQYYCVGQNFLVRQLPP